MRLIDADSLLKRMQNDPLFDLVERYGVSGVIEAEPTVDAVPVIRCKDCKYWNGSGKYCDYEMSGLEDDFCSWAKREEE